MALPEFTVTEGLQVTWLAGCCRSSWPTLLPYITTSKSPEERHKRRVLHLEPISSCLCRKSLCRGSRAISVKRPASELLCRMMGNWGAVEKFSKVSSVPVFSSIFCVYDCPDLSATSAALTHNWSVGRSRQHGLENSSPF